MKDKKLIIAVIVLIAIVGIMAGIWFATRPETHQGAKTITVTVVHKDGTEVVKTYHTDEEYLGPVLVAEGLVICSEGPFGLQIDSVDGEEAIWDKHKAYWALYVGDKYAELGVSSTPVADGDTFKLVYTLG